jgi:hypothetical protein
MKNILVQKVRFPCLADTNHYLSRGSPPRESHQHIAGLSFLGRGIAYIYLVDELTSYLILKVMSSNFFYLPSTPSNSRLKS